jgi:hypothetical protein
MKRKVGELKTDILSFGLILRSAIWKYHRRTLLAILRNPLRQ